MVKEETPTINRYTVNIAPDNFWRTQEVDISSLAPCSLEEETEGSPGTTDTQRENPLNMVPCRFHLMTETFLPRFFNKKTRHFGICFSMSIFTKHT